MRGSWFATVLALALGACAGEDVDRAWTGVMAPRQVVPAKPDYLGPTPPDVVATPGAYVACIAKKQAAPEYAVLWGKLFFHGSAAAAAAPAKTKATPDEEWAVERWEIERKDCLNLADTYTGYFAHTDPDIVARFVRTQAAIRDAHVDLSHQRTSYAAAVARIRAAEEGFWRASSTNHRGMSAVVTERWLQALPTM